MYVCVFVTVYMCNVVFKVINAARTLVVITKSRVARENMDVFRDTWFRQIKILTEAVDDITTIDDFLAVTGKPGT